MKAVAVFPGKPDTVHLAELAQPSVRDIPNGRGVLVKVLRVGVDGTDKEINAAEYGAAPEGFDFLVLGHDSPHEPRGCIAQAWSVAEILRAAVEDVFAVKPEPKRSTALRSAAR